MGLGVLTVGLGLEGLEVQWGGSRVTPLSGPAVSLCCFAILDLCKPIQPQASFFFPFRFFYNLNYPSASLSRCS